MIEKYKNKIVKNLSRIMPLGNPEKSDFKQRVLSLIASESYYYYPETRNNYLPVDGEIKIEASWRKRNQRKSEAWRNFIQSYDVKKLEESYSLFNDVRSKEMFVFVIAYTLCDPPIIRFPQYYSRSFDQIQKIESFALDNDIITLWNGIIKLKKFNLSWMGFDITLWHNPTGLMIEFLQDQYRYKNIVKIEENDCVIDGGACYGDTALHFAAQTKGNVYAFEFMNENLDIFEKNMALNPKYKDQVTLVKKPLWNKSGEKLFFVANGPGTSININEIDNSSGVETISIDDFVEQNGIEKVDFIKLDVEGSEEAILKGAIKTIRKFRPKLAICGYHKRDDLVVLPRLIKDIIPDYKLYLDHNTINHTETVIYAKV
jgi:FkbM family methyltransferase